MPSVSSARAAVVITTSWANGSGVVPVHSPLSVVAGDAPSERRMEPVRVAGKMPSMGWLFRRPKQAVALPGCLSNSPPPPLMTLSDDQPSNAAASA